MTILTNILHSVLSATPCMDVKNISKLIQDMMYLKVVEEHYNTDQLKCVECFDFDQKYSYYQAWYENGNRQSKCTCKDGVPYGLYQSWYEDGTLQLQCNFDHDNKLHGPYKRWYENGVLAIEATYYESALVTYKEYHIQRV